MRPPRRSSRSMASLIMPSLYSLTYVSTGKRSSGGDSITLISRPLTSAKCSVRGMGVALSVSTSIPVRHFLIFSFCATPKRCSSSIIKRPKLGNCTSACSKRWVPIKISTLPSSRSCKIRFCSLVLQKRFSISTFTPKLRMRSLKVKKCCCASTVVGTITATCLPSTTALKAARIATSVLP